MKPPPRALIVDSHKPICELIAAILRSVGHVTETAYSQAQGLGRIDATRYDLLIADHATARNVDRSLSFLAGSRPEAEAPTAGSYTTPLLFVRAREKNPLIQIVIMAPAFPAQESCDFGFLAKPFTYRDLVDKIGLAKIGALRTTRDERLEVTNAAEKAPAA